MSLSEKELWELGELASAAADGWISDDQRARLEQLLASSEEARKHYLRLSGISAGAAWIAHAEPAVRSAWTPRRLRVGPSLWTGWAAAAVLAIVAGGVWFKTRPQTPQNTIARTLTTDPAVAVLNDAYNVEWADAQEPNHVGNVLRPGTLRLKSGLAQVQFLNGANVLMEGPAELDLLSPSEGKCTSGKVLVDVPREAHGFRINASYIAIAEPGAGFGVDVDKGQAAIHVFRGQVQIHGRGDQMTPIEAGAALMMQRDGAFKPMSANMQEFNAPMPPEWYGGFGPRFPGFEFDGFGGPPMGFPPMPGYGPGQGGPPGYGYSGFFNGQGRWKGFDPLDSVRWQLHASNERWNQIGPDVAAYLDAQRNADGSNGFESPVTRAQLGLWQTQSDPNATDSELARKVAGLRHAREQGRQDLETARSSLVAKLSTWEQAQLVSSGVLQ